MTSAIRSARASAGRVAMVAGARMLLRRRREHFLDVLPVHQAFEESLEIVGPAIAVVDVVGVLPHVAAEDRRAAVYQRVLAVRRLRDGELAVLHRDPAPAGTELSDAGLREVFLHLGDAAEVLVDRRLELARNLVATAVRLHPLPEMNVVVMLAGIVEET